MENIYPFPQHDTQKMFPSIVLSGFHISSPSAKRGIKHIIKNKKLTLKPINYPSRYTQTTLKQVLSKEFNVTSPTLTPHPPTLPQPSACLRGMLSLANGNQTFKEFDMTNLRQTHDECTDSPRARLTDY